MAKIDNYIITDNNHCLTTSLLGSVVCGEVFEDDMYQSEKRIQKKIIGLKRYKGEPETIIYVGEEESYELATPHKDYTIYLDAVKEGYPIIREWQIFGNKEIGYRVLGKVEGKVIIDDIFFQDENFIFNRDGRAFFVDWFSCSELYLKKIIKSQKLLDIDYFTEFDYFGTHKCRPRLNK